MNMLGSVTIRVRCGLAPLVMLAPMWFCVGPAPGQDDSRRTDASRAKDDVETEQKIASALARGLPIVQKAAVNYPNNRDCFSCHHQTLPMLAVVTAGTRGIEPPKDLLVGQAEFTRDSFQTRADQLKRGEGIGGRAMTVAYGLWALSLADWPADETTEAMVTYLLKTQAEDGRWIRQTERPPLEESYLTATVLAVRGIQRYSTAGQKADAQTAIARAKSWLATAPIKSHEDRVARLWGEHVFDGASDAIAVARELVVAAQRDDGGWAQLDEMPSDAYSTGQTLWVLGQTGLDRSDKVYQRGVSFLLKTQRDDGSWFVASRSNPIQTFFDNGDPHGKDQFISTPATCWALSALAATTPAPQ
jgi:N-acyl-D-amino-acid deacylase